MVYNPVTNPNPEGSRPTTRIKSQGHDGNIVNDEDEELIGNTREQTGLPFGEDQC